MELIKLTALTRRAIAGGATIVNPYRVDWDISGKCQAPVTRELHGRFYDKNGECNYSPGMPPARRVMLDVRCRKCTKCLQYRRYQWQQKAQRETFLGVRTWFVTLTLRPHEHMLAQARATLRLRKDGVEFKQLSDKEQFLERHKEIGKLLTKYVKRLRSYRYKVKDRDGTVIRRYRAPLRYVLISERHKSGLPHYHMLVHELDAMRPCRESKLNALWGHGFVTAKLADADTAQYVTKYIAKDASARVRASGRYGDGSSALRQSIRKQKGTGNDSACVPPPSVTTQPNTECVPELNEAIRPPPRAQSRERSDKFEGSADNGQPGISDRIQGWGRSLQKRATADAGSSTTVPGVPAPQGPTTQPRSRELQLPEIWVVPFRPGDPPHPTGRGQQSSILDERQSGGEIICSSSGEIDSRARDWLAVVRTSFMDD